LNKFPIFTALSSLQIKSLPTCITILQELIATSIQAKGDNKQDLQLLVGASMMKNQKDNWVSAKTIKDK